VSRDPRHAQIVGLVGFLIAALLPFLLFGHVVSAILQEFRLDIHYFLAEWTPWTLIVIGLLFLAPVAFSSGRDPDSRWYPRARNVYAGWGITLYLLGFGLGTQVAQIYALGPG
jgi:hypothetical protein